MSELEKDVVANYSLLGPKECSIRYNVSYCKIMWIAEKFKLFVDKRAISNIKKNATTNYWKNKKTIHAVNQNIFIGEFTKESTYLLGFIWGDGYISDSGTNNQIRIECVSEDINELKPIFDKTGNWTYNKRTRVGKKREVTIASTSNKELVKFLIENDYKNKSRMTPEKIWSKIPLEYRKYFVLGWIDADGCFYHNNKWSSNQFYLSGSYEQDWGIFENILNELNIKHKVLRIKNKTKYSCVRVTNKKEIKKIGDYIYDDLFPLKRKHDKYLLIINNLHNAIN